MIITGTELYWITRLDSINAFLIGYTVLTGVMGGTFLFIGCIESIRKSVIAGIVLLCVTIILNLGIVFIPTTKEYCAIKVIPMVANNEYVQDMPNRVLGLASEWINYLKPTSKETNK